MARRPLSCVSLAVAAGLLLTLPLQAQGTIHTWYGDVSYQGHGRAVANLGDINGDGSADILVGAPWDNQNGIDAGMARIYSGATGIWMWEALGDASQDAYGDEVCSVGDLDGDGHPDFIVSAPRSNVVGMGCGSVYVYSGYNLSLLYRVDGDEAKDFLGTSIAGLGDIDGDGHADWIAGAWEYDPGINPGDGYGYARVFSGNTGAILFDVVGQIRLGFLGYAVGNAGDVNGDGICDFTVGSYGDDTADRNAGRVDVHSGADASVLYTVYGDTKGDKLGNELGWAGDVDGDGVDDWIAGASNADMNGSFSGQARLYSGATGATIYTWYGTNPDDEFGLAVSGGHDMTGDGVPDIVVGIRGGDVTGSNSGSMAAFSGADGSEIWTAHGDATHDLMGYAVSLGPDVNGDGIADPVAGGSQYDSGPGPGNGIARVYDPTVPPPPPPPYWPSLPSAFQTINGYMLEDFESHAGQMPPWMEVNRLLTMSRLPDATAWCNMGQLGPCTGGVSNTLPRSGNFCLEMGVMPNGPNSNTLSNGFIMGLDGTGTAQMELSFWVFDHGDESNDDDGVFISNDGVNWEKVYDGWSTLPDGVWTEVTGIDLTSTSVDVTGQFYMLFGQADNYPIGDGDGVSVDDIEIGFNGMAIAAVTPGVAGTNNTIHVTGANPSGVIYYIYGFAQGTTPLPGCATATAGIRTPTLISAIPANASGYAGLTVPVPGAASGVTVLLQAIELYACEVTAVLPFTFQ